MIHLNSSLGDHDFPGQVSKQIYTYNSILAGFPPFRTHKISLYFQVFFYYFKVTQILIELKFTNLKSLSKQKLFFSGIQVGLFQDFKLRTSLLDYITNLVGQARSKEVLVACLIFPGFIPFFLHFYEKLQNSMIFQLYGHFSRFSKNTAWF